MHIRALLLLSILFCPIIAITQTEDLTKIMDQAFQLEYSNPDSAIILYKYARSQAEQFGGNEIATQATYYQGLVYMQLAKFDSCEILLLKAQKGYERLGDHQQLAKVLIAFANSLNHQGNYEASLTSYQRALDAAIDIDDPLMQARILSNQSSIFNSTFRIESALSVLRRARTLAEPLGPSVFLADIFHNFAVNHQALYQYDSAISYAQRAANLYDELGNDLYQALALTNLSAYLHEQTPPKLEESKIILDKSRSILDTLYAPSVELNYWKHLSYYHYKKEQYNLARKNAQTCMEWLQIHPDLPSERNIYEFLYGIHKKQGQLDSALKYHEKYAKARDTLIFAESRLQLQELQAKYETVKKDEEITLKSLLLSRRTSQRNIILLGLLVTILLIWFTLDRSKRSRKLQTEKIQSLKRYQKILVMDSMLQGQEEERKRIAQDLHDGLGTLLVSASLQVQNAHRQLQKIMQSPILENTENLIDNACKEVRRIAHDMMPSALIDLGFVDAIGDLLTDISSQQYIQIDFNAPDPMPIIKGATSLNLYRIIQEILQNVVKHAQANVVGVYILLEENDQILIEVSDDGVGFNTDSDKDGIGLRNIRSRIEYLNGQLRLESKPGEGCTYIINVPRQT